MKKLLCIIALSLIVSVMVIPFISAAVIRVPYPGVRALVSTLVDRTAGTAIGNMTSSGGLASAFDSNIDQSTGQGAEYSGSDAYVGKDWGSGVTKSIDYVNTWGSNNSGYIGNTGTTTLTLQGSTDNFSASIVDLGTTNFSNQYNALPKTVTATVTTAYRYHRLKINRTDSGGIYCAELTFYEWK